MQITGLRVDLSLYCCRQIYIPQCLRRKEEELSLHRSNPDFTVIQLLPYPYAIQHGAYGTPNHLFPL